MTPLCLLLVEGQAAELRCELCAAVLALGESWLAEVDRRVPRQTCGAPRLSEVLVDPR